MGAHGGLRESKVVCLRNMVGAEEVDESLEEEIEGECSKYGEVENVIIYNVSFFAVLRIHFILIWIRILLQIRPKIEKISTFVLLFFSYKKNISPKYVLFCYLWGKY